MAFSELFKILGGLGVTVALISSAMWLILKIYGERWLHSHFERELANYRNEHSRELERLKLQINSQFDRTTKLHQREFEVLPEAWRLLHVAFGHAADCCTRFRSYTDISRMNKLELDELLSHSGFSEWQISCIHSSDNKQEKYNRFIDAIQMGLAIKSRGEFHNFLLENGIFLQEPIKSMLNRANETVRLAVQERQYDMQERDTGPDRFKHGDEMLDQGPQLLKQIEEAVSSKLWTSQIH